MPRAATIISTRGAKGSGAAGRLAAMSTVTGSEETARAMLALPERVRNNALRRVFPLACEVIVQAMRQPYASQTTKTRGATGTMRAIAAAWTHRIKEVKRSSGARYVRAKVYAAYTGKGGASGIDRNTEPAQRVKLAHLVEWGRSKRAPYEGWRIASDAFMRVRTRARGILRTGIAAIIESEGAKLGGKRLRSAVGLGKKVRALPGSRR